MKLPWNLHLTWTYSIKYLGSWLQYHNLKSCDRTGCRTLKKKSVLSFRFHLKSRRITCLSKVHFWKFCQMFTWFHTANVHPFSQWFWGQPSQGYPHGPNGPISKMPIPAAQLSCSEIQLSNKRSSWWNPVTPTKVDLQPREAGRIFFPEKTRPFCRRFWRPWMCGLHGRLWLKWQQSCWILGTSTSRLSAPSNQDSFVILGGYFAQDISHQDIVYTKQNNCSSLQKARNTTTVTLDFFGDHLRALRGFHTWTEKLSDQSIKESGLEPRSKELAHERNFFNPVGELLCHKPLQKKTQQDQNNA